MDIDQSTSGTLKASKLRAQKIASDRQPLFLSDVLSLGPFQFGGDGLVGISDVVRNLTELGIERARDSLAAPTFAERNAIASQAVAQESALLAAWAVGAKDYDSAGLIYDIFKKATLEAGELFKPAFNERGEKIETKQKEYKKAMSEAAVIACKYLGELMWVLPPAAQRANSSPEELKKSALDVLRRACVEDVCQAIAIENFPVSGHQSAGEMHQAFKEVVDQDDYFYGKIDSMENRFNEHRFLTLAMRLANATWRVGQPHRAAWEGNDSRINPSAQGREGMYSPFDVLRAFKYNQTLVTKTRELSGLEDGQQRAHGLAFTRVVFEFFKDLDQLQSKMPIDGEG